MNNEILPFLFERGQVFLKDDGEIIFIRAVFNRENDKKIEAVSEHGYIYSFYESRSPALRLYTSADKAAPVGDVYLDNAREVFEKWITANGDYPHLKHKSFGGNYLHEEVAMKWDGFRAGYYTKPKQSAPVERIEGLAVAISKLASSDYGDRPLCDNEYIVIKAARAYLKLQGGE